MKRTTLDELRNHLRAGKTYRRAELVQWSKSVDRHVQALVKEGTLNKLSGGLYYCPKKSVFGEVPADDLELVRAFLKDDRFLLTSPNAYNALGLGTTQLYNTRVVYNHKRHGMFTLGGRVFDFRLKHHFPKDLTSEESLLVDLLNNLDELAEDRKALLERARAKVPSMNAARLARATKEFATLSTKKFVQSVLSAA